MSLFVYRLPASKPIVYRISLSTIHKNFCVSWSYHKIFCGYPHIEFVPQAVAFFKKGADCNETQV